MTVGFSPTALAQKRCDKGLSQAGLASLLGVTRQAVSEWERSKNTPMHDTLPALAAALDCLIDDLFTAPDGAAK
jgi:transcriptional regulator with XRE-family HTH domain